MIKISLLMIVVCGITVTIFMRRLSQLEHGKKGKIALMAIADKIKRVDKVETLIASLGLAVVWIVHVVSILL